MSFPREVLFAVALGLTAVPVAAQVSATISGGAASYDLSGTGTSAITAVRVEVGLGAGVAAEVGSAFFRYTTQSDARVSMLIPEAGVAVGVPRTPVRVTAGVGHTLLLRGSWPEEFTLYVGLGANVGDPSGWGIRPEIRVHNVDPWAATIAEFSVGLRRRID